MMESKRTAHKILAATAGAILALALAAPGVHAEGTLTHQDPAGRFSFEYPQNFGAVSPGTNNGFGGRVAALRFSDFSSGLRQGTLVLGGEAVVTRGPVQVDLQALGGLYDPFAAEVLPAPLKALLKTHLPPLGAANFCPQLAREDHVDWRHPDFAALSPAQITAAQALDRLRNEAPDVVECRELENGLIVFHKRVIARFGAASSPQHVYGVVHFFDTGISSFQIVRAGSEAPGRDLLMSMEAIARSFRWRGR